MLKSIPISRIARIGEMESFVRNHDTELQRLHQAAMNSVLSDGQPIGNFPGSVAADPGYATSGGGGGGTYGSPGGGVITGVSTSALTSSASDHWGTPHSITVKRKVYDPSGSGTPWPMIDSTDPDDTVYIRCGASSIASGVTIYYQADTMPDGSTQYLYLGKGEC
jgi:hypothetical protein